MWSSRRQFGRLGRVQIDAYWIEISQNCLGVRHFLGRAPRGDQERVGPDCGLISEHLVFRNARSVERGAKGAETTHDDTAFDRGDQHRREIAEHDHATYDLYRNENAAKQPTPKSAPDGAVFASELHPVAYIIKAGNLFIGVVSLTDNVEMSHVDAGICQFPDRGFSCLVIGEYGDHGVKFGHVIFLFDSKAILTVPAMREARSVQHLEQE